MGRCRPQPKLKVPSRHLTGVTESGWSASGIDSRASRMLSQCDTRQRKSIQARI